MRTMTEAQRGAKREYDRAYVRKRYAANPEARRERSRKWTKENPQARRTKDATRRARKLNACPSWSNAADIAQREAARWVFASLHGVDDCDVHLDHIIPLKAAIYIDGKLTQIASGLHVYDNLTFKLASANCSKGNRFDEAELIEHPYFEQVTYVTHINSTTKR